MTGEEFHYLLKLIIKFLPLPESEWPLEDTINREAARLLLINLFNLDPRAGDDELAATAAAKLSQIAREELTVGNLPLDLQEKVRLYDEHLEKLGKQREEALRKMFTRFDRKTQNSLEQYTKLIQKRLVGKEKLPEKIAKGTAEDITIEIAHFLPQTVRPETLTEETYQATLKRAQSEIEKTLTQKGISQPKEIANYLISQSVAKETLATAQLLAVEPRRIPTTPPLTGPPTITPEERKVVEAKEDFNGKVNAELAKFSELAENPKERQELSRNLVGKTGLYLQILPRKEITQDEYREVLENAWQRVREDFEAKGVILSKPQTEELVNNLVKNTQKEAVIITTMVPRYYSKEQLTQMAQEPEGVAFLTAYTALQPQVAATRTQRVIIAPAVIPLKAAASEATPEWQEMIEKGVFIEDIEASIAKLKKAGLSGEHPLIISLENKKARFLEQQKIRIVRPDGTIILRDKPAVGISKRYHLFSKLTGRHQIFDEETGIFLPQTSPPPIWSKKSGYSWQLRRGLNNLGTAVRFFEEVEIGPGKRVIRFTLPSRIVRKITFGRFESFGAIRTIIYRKTIGRAVSYVGKKLAETAIGKAVKEGLKKAATWVATKLGVQTAVTAAGAAVAPETAGVSLLVAAAINLAIEVGGKILGKIWEKVKTVFREPEKALAVLGIGVAVAFLPMPIAIIAVVPIIVGSLGLISWGAASAGVIASGLAAKMVAFTVAVATLPLTAPIAMFIIAILTTLATITFFIVMTTAGAFILPVGPTELIEEMPPPPAPPDIPPPSGLTFRWPVDSPYTCSSNYGYRTLTIRGVTTCDYHEGIDIPAFAGASVYSTTEGEVVGLGYNSGYGTYVVVKHDGLYSFYAHLLATTTYVGEKVDQSSVIGYVDDTGWSTGTHLHFGFSSCGSVPSCFNNGSLTPNPCSYLSCPSNCEYRDRTTGCPGL